MTNKLLYSRFFKSRDGQAWRYYLWDTIVDFRRVIKYSHQRARRGWADCDVWSMDSWFCAVVPGMLRQLADNHHGAPICMFPEDKLEASGLVADDKYHENWGKVLHQ